MNNHKHKTDSKPGLKLFPAKDIERFTQEVLQSAGVMEEIAALVARGLVLTSLRGVDSHGIRLLPHYISAVTGGRINPDPSPSFRRTSASTGILDADHTFGHAAGIIAMNHAVELAKEAGTGHVAVKNSTHCGSMAYYAEEACKHDMIGLAFTHATPRVRSANGIRPFFGTNPICFAAPMESEGPFCFDSAITKITSNKLKIFREEGRDLPPDAAADSRGKEVLDPEAAFQLLPIGDYKGFGLAMVVDILCGLMSGMPVGENVSQMYGNPLSEIRRLGHFFSALRIDAFEEAGRFKRRLQELADAVRGEPSASPGAGVMAPGDPEKRVMKERLEKGIPIGPVLLDKLKQIAGKSGIPFVA